MPALKGKRARFTRSAKRVFSNKPAGGPTSLLHLAVPPPPPLCCSPFGNFVSFAFGLRFSLSVFALCSLFGSPSQGNLIPLPFPLASHTPSVCKAFSNFFLLYDCYQFPFSLLVFTHSKRDLPSSIYYLPYISLYFLFSPIPIKTNIGLVFSSFFFLPLSFHTFKTML